MRGKILFIILPIILIMAFSACDLDGSDNTDDITSLGDVEVREYEGEDLSSLNDFRENSIIGPQYIDIDTYLLKIYGMVENPVELTYEEVLKNDKYSKVVTLYCVEGWDVKILWEGIKLLDIFGDVKVSEEANTVIFHAVDGYTTSLPLQYVIDKDLLLAYKMNSVVLPPERGYPFQLIAEDKLGYKWIKWIIGIELSDDEDYEGYWERRGYSNEADVEN